jgi:hypothetical protein
VLCAFLPAMRVCNDPALPIGFPPCYAAYFGGVGVVMLALTRHRALARLGAGVVFVLAELCAGGVISLFYVDQHPTTAIAVCGLTIVVAVLIMRWLVRATLSERTLAGIAICQGILSTGWATLLACDDHAMWGAKVTLVAALALVGTALAWHREIPLVAPVPAARML